MVGKVFERLVNNRIPGQLRSVAIFSDFQNGFRFSLLTANLLKVVSDRNDRAFNSSGATRVVALDISNAFDSL